MVVNLAPERTVYTPSSLNQTVRQLLEGSFPLIWLEGEISNLSRPSSGHLYFSLKDAKAQVRCALFYNRARLLREPIANGQQVLVRARISLYEARGEFQLIVEHVEDAGDGALRRAYEALRRRLEQEGLFAQERKQALPALPRRLGVITSPSGAAIRDVLSVLQRRFPGLPVLIYPVPVQGEGAGAEIAQMIDLASARRDCDVLLLVRGGGSLEDLWAFNEEIVARAIANCSLPVVSGVGHETDVTIADFVADVRAPTPSAAAELVSPDSRAWLQKFAALETRLDAAMRRLLAQRRQTLAWQQQRLTRQHPGRRLQEQAQLLDELEQRLCRAMLLHLERLQSRVGSARGRLRVQAPGPQIRSLQVQQQELRRRLQAAMRQRLAHEGQRLRAAARALDAMSPLATLGRGYALVWHEEGGLLRRAQDAEIGEKIDVQLSEGRLICSIDEIKD